MGRLLALTMTLAACTAPTTQIAVPPSAVSASFASTAAPTGSGEFDAERARAHLAFFSDPARGGRYTASKGYDESARYMADRFREIGLEPLGDDGTYFQHFTMPLVDLRATPMLERMDPSPKAFTHRVDFTESVSGRAGNGDAAGSIVVVGGGSKSGGMDDFAGASVRGKIALITGPSASGGGSALENAFREGATAVIVTGSPDIRFSFIPRFDEPTLPVLVVAERVVDELLAPSGTRTADVRALVQARHADPTLAETAFEVPGRVRVAVPLTPLRDVDAMNVVGLLRAGDSEGSKRALLVGGHLDGVGTDPNGTVFQAANDNASGPAIVIEVARALVARRAELKHSVVFVAWAGEEEGLLGSDAYAMKMAAIPGRAESLIGVLNLDVIGCCGDKLTASSESKELQGTVRGVAGELGVPFGPGGGGSDQSSFVKRRVPAILIAYSEPILHTTRDTIALITTARIRDAGRVVTEAARRIASAN